MNPKTGIILTSNQLDPTAYWTRPLSDNFIPKFHDLDLFDQNGYDLTNLEKLYAEANMWPTQTHRQYRTNLKRPWFEQEYQEDGPILNHSLLFERKGYAGEALDQLLRWSKFCSRVYQLITLRPKWGLDFSMDYVDHQGNCFEILHWEYDSFDHAEIQDIKSRVEPIILSIDWDHAAQQMIAHKDQWHHLDFFAQSDWKSKYFGMPKERFKMVAWE